MGGCCSAPAAADGSMSGSRRSGSRRSGGKQSSMAPLQHSHLDPGLSDTHEYMGRLGRGGTGEICAFRDNRNGQQVPPFSTFATQRTSVLSAMMHGEHSPVANARTVSGA